MLHTYLTHRGAYSPLLPVIAACKRALLSVAVASGVINVLTLTGSIFMMQVYDRVLGSQSVPTLIALSIMAIAAYAFQGWLEAVRGRILTLIGEKIDADLGPAVHAAGVKAAVSVPGGQAEAAQAVRDLDAIRAFVAGTGLVAAFDMPWLFLYVAFAFLLHPYFGFTVLGSAALLIWLTWRNERASKALLKEVNELNVRRTQVSDGIVRNAETVSANGMREAMAGRLTDVQQRYLTAQRGATFVVGRYTTMSKSIRMVLQSFVLGLGAYLAIKGQISGGAIIAASILVSRALAPIDQAIASWRPFVAARDGHERLTKLLTRFPADRKPLALPAPKETFAVKDLGVAAPGAQTFAIAGVTLQLKAGDAMCIIGHSGSGKSSLIRGIVGTWKPVRGSVSFDDTGPEQWDPDVLGKSIGYLPQDIQLFDGTIAENIARFDPDATPQKIQAASMAAGLDTYIRKTFARTGYDTVVTAGGGNISGGQRQRIGLARALYGDPFLVVLDEPNSNLDAAGKAALQQALKAIKARGGIAIVSAHDHNVLTECDAVLTLNNGAMEFFGGRDEVMKKWIAKHQRHGEPQAANINTPPQNPAGGGAAQVHAAANGASPARSAQGQANRAQPQIAPPRIYSQLAAVAGEQRPQKMSWSTAPVKLGPKPKGGQS